MERIKFDGFDLFALIRWAMLITIIIFDAKYCNRPNSEDYIYLGKLVKEQVNVVRIDDETHEFTNIPYLITYKTDQGEIKDIIFEHDHDYKKITSNEGVLVYIDHHDEYDLLFACAFGLYFIFLLIICARCLSESKAHWGNPFKPLIALLQLPRLICCGKNKQK